MFGDRISEEALGAFALSVCDPQCCVSPQSRTIGLNPLYVMLPCTLSASFAFMLPVATPPNAIVFAYGHLKVSDMVMQPCRRSHPWGCSVVRGGCPLYQRRVLPCDVLVPWPSLAFISVFAPLWK